MKLIAHRGNVFGQNLEKENHPDYILEALEYGCEVELDLWAKDNDLFLGHSSPDYPISSEFLESNSEKFWVHCKNIEALWICMFKLKNIHYFWHQEDDVSVTSKKIFWTYPGKPLTPNSVLLILNEEALKKEQIGGDIYGICTDYVDEVKGRLINA
jgi:hypothetical protein